MRANAAQVSFRLADLRYRNGAASFLDVLDAQRNGKGKLARGCPEEA